MEVKSPKKWGTLLWIGIIIFTILILTGITIRSNIASDGRPKYCIDDKCADEYVFSELPEYPSDLREVALGVELNAYGLPEDFSNRYLDEN